MGVDVHIYALIDPETREVRYIGKTKNIKYRMIGHYALKIPGLPKWEWLNSLICRGLVPICEILETCDASIGLLREMVHIQQNLSDGAPLLNVFVSKKSAFEEQFKTRIKMKSFEKLKHLLQAAEADVIKADGGNAAAAVRVRAAMQKIKATAQEMRTEALALKKA